MLSSSRRLYARLSGVELAHVVLYVWLLLGKIWVVISGEIPLPGTQPLIQAGWLLIGFAAPAMIFFAYAAIRWRSGRWRYAGFWLRTGADVSQITIMIIFTANLFSHAFGTDEFGHHIFMSFFMGALLTFLASMIMRDVLALVITEELAWRIRRDEDE